MVVFEDICLTAKLFSKRQRLILLISPNTCSNASSGMTPFLISFFNILNSQYIAVHLLVDRIVVPPPFTYG